MTPEGGGQPPAALKNLIAWFCEELSEGIAKGVVARLSGHVAPVKEVELPAWKSAKGVYVALGMSKSNWYSLVRQHPEIRERCFSEQTRSWNLTAVKNWRREHGRE